MPITIDIRRDEEGNMEGKLHIKIYESSMEDLVYSCYVRDFNQAILDVATFLKENFEDDGADICWK